MLSVSISVSILPYGSCQGLPDELHSTHPTVRITLLFGNLDFGVSHVTFHLVEENVAANQHVAVESGDREEKVA